VACVATATGPCCRGTVKLSHVGWETTQLGRITAVDMLDYAAIGTPVTSAQVLLGSSRMKLCDGVLVGAGGKNVGDLIMGGKKPLHLPPGRLEAFHDPLSSSRRLVGVLRPVVEAFVLTAQHSLADGSLGRLASKAAGSRPRSDRRLVTTHCRFF
jgi:hypothetical protein